MLGAFVKAEKHADKANTLHIQAVARHNLFMFVIIGLILLALAIVCWAFSWLIFVGIALLVATLFVGAKSSPIEYSIGGLRRYCIALWSLIQNPKLRLQLCALTGAGVAVLRVVAWSAVAFADHVRPNGAANVVAAITFPEVFLLSLKSFFVAVCSLFILESVLVSLTLWMSLIVARGVFHVAARMWPRLENKIRHSFLNWLQKA